MPNIIEFKKIWDTRFFEHEEYGLCGITCAHVLLNKQELLEHPRGRKRYQDGTHYVYQPSTKRPRNRMGLLKETFFSSGERNEFGMDLAVGERNEFGMDLAVFQIQDRPPKSGEFPTDKGDEPMCYDKGRVIRESEINLYRAHVVKFGRTTQRTEGYVNFVGTAVKKVNFEVDFFAYDPHQDFTLLDQTEVRPSYSESIFSDAGDSGAFVFSKTIAGDLGCIGMVVGNLMLEDDDGTSRRGNSMVIPAGKIQKELGVRQFKTFIWNKMDHVEARLRSIDKHLEKVDNIEKNVEKILKQMTSRKEMGSE